MRLRPMFPPSLSNERRRGEKILIFDLCLIDLP
jgi:hypothetical protein